MTEERHDYQKMTQEQFDSILDTLARQHGIGWLLGLGGVYEIVSEELNNDVLSYYEEHGCDDVSPDQPRELTQLQRDLIGVLRTRDGEMTAEFAEKAWKTGHRFNFDPRNDATRGIRRQLEKANNQATAGRNE